MSSSSSIAIENVYGVGSFRLCAGFPSSIKTMQQSDIHLYESPLNGCIHIYDHSMDERRRLEPVYDDIMVVMLYNEHVDQILTCSYSGQIIIWSKNYDKRLIEQQTRINHIHYGCWTRDGTSIYLCSRFDGTIISFAYDSLHHSLTENWLRHWATPHQDTENLHSPSSNIPASSITLETLAETIETSNTYVAGSIGYEFVICTAVRRRIFAILQRPQQHVRIHELDPHHGHLINELQLEPAKPKQLFLCGTTITHFDSTIGKELFAIGLQSGLIFILNTDPLQIHSILNANGSPQAIIWWQSYLLTIGYVSSIVNVFSMDGSLIASGDGAPMTAVCHLQWNSDEQELLWIGGYMGLTLVRLELLDENSSEPVQNFMFTIMNTIVDEPRSSLSVTTILQKCLHETAGCGLYLDGERILSGDLGGHIFEWSTNESAAKRHVIIQDSVRCFVSDNLVGTLSGLLYNIETQEIVDDFRTTVICSAWNRDKNRCLIGLGDGQLLDLQTRKIIGLHANNVEIWSVCWSPDEEFCATASEDQTTCIWHVNEEQHLVMTLRGHTTAVTAVQWKSQRIYTCADDRTVRVYNAHSNDYSLLYVFHTPKSLFGWFTLTYMRVDERRNLIICVTQNGYLVVWREEKTNENNNLPLICRKIHFGSLEGLAYDENTRRLVTIGSDCTVTSLRLLLD